MEDSKVDVSRNINRRRTRRDVDEGWAWVVLSASTVGLFLLCLCYTGGIFNIIFLEEFNMSKQKTAWLTAVQGSLMSLAAPIGSVLIAKVGHRGTAMIGGLFSAVGYFLTFFVQEFVSLLLCFGFLVGIGFGICYVSCIVVISEYFDRYRNVAFGTALGISATGNAVLPLFIVNIVQYFGWRGSMLIFSGFYMQQIICGTVYGARSRKPQTVETSEILRDDKVNHNGLQNVDGGSRHTDSVQISGPNDDKEQSSVELSASREHHSLMTEVPRVGDQQKMAPSGYSIPEPKRKPLAFMKRKDFVLLCITVFNNNAGTMITFIHFPAYFVQQGATEQRVAVCLMFVGIANIICRLVGGVASNNKDFDVLLVYMVSCGIVAVLLFVCPLMAGSFTGQMTFCVLFGMYGNWVYSLLPPVIVHILDKEDLNMALGVECFFGGIGGLIGPPLAGWLYDISGTYVYSFYTAGAMYGLSLLLVMVTPIYSPKYQLPQRNR